MKRCFVLLLCSFWVQILAGQSPVVDSLQALLGATTAPQVRANLLAELAKATLEINPPQALAYAREAETLMDPQAVALKGKVYEAKGLALMYLGQLPAADTTLDRAAVYLEDAGADLALVTRARCAVYYSMAQALMYRAPEQAVAYTDKVLALTAADNHYQLGIAYNVQASAYGSLSEHERALALFDSSLYHMARAEDTLQARFSMAATYSNQGAVYAGQSRYEEAAALYYRAMELYDELGQPEQKGVIFTNLLDIYLYLKDPEGAMKTVQKSIALAHMQTPMDTAFLNRSYYNLAFVYGTEGRIDTSLEILDAIVPFFERNEEYDMLARCYLLKGTYYEELGKVDQALAYLERAAALQDYFSSERTLQLLRRTQAELYRETGQLERSRALYRQLIDSTTYTDPSDRIASLNGGIETARLLQDYELAYTYFEQKALLEDSVAAISQLNILRDLEVRYQTKEVQQQNAALEKERAYQRSQAVQNRRLFYLTVGLAVLLVGLLLLLLRYNAVKSNAQQKELKFQLLRNQMNPHFLFNVLGAIQRFIYTNNPIKAGDFLSSFATLVRDILDNSTEEYVPVGKEIQWLKNYVALQALRFEEHLTYTIDIDPQLQQGDYLLPPMLIQPIIENALEHGFKDIDYQGHLNITMKLSNDAIDIEIQDNGVGFDPNRPTPRRQEHTSHATRITRERIALLNKKNQKKITFETVSAPQKGTTVRFSVPLDT